MRLPHTPGGALRQILNLNGHSLMLQNNKKYRPAELVPLFAPISEPTQDRKDLQRADTARGGFYS